MAQINPTIYMNFQSSYETLQSSGSQIFPGELVRHFFKINSTNIPSTDTITKIKVSFTAKIQYSTNPIDVGFCLAEYSSAFFKGFSAQYDTGTTTSMSRDAAYAACKSSVSVSSTQEQQYEVELSIPNAYSFLNGMFQYGISIGDMAHSHHIGLALGAKNAGKSSNVLVVKNLKVEITNKTTSPTPTKNINVSVNPSEAGSVTGGGNCGYFSEITLKATPSNSSYTFTGWSDPMETISTTNTTYSFIVTRNRNITANFTKAQVAYKINVSANPPSYGQVQTSRTDNTFDENTWATVTASPYSGYEFVSWTENGTVVSTNASYEFKVTSSRALVANFKTATINKYQISASASPTSGGSVSGAGTYDWGDTVTLKATTSAGYTFINWTENGTIVSTSSTYSFTVNSNRTLVANFQQNAVNTYQIKASASPATGGYIVSGTGTYNERDTATLKASAYNGYKFVNWTENGSEVSTSSTYSFTVNSNRTLVANFISTAQSTGTITVRNNGPFTLPGKIGSPSSNIPAFNQENTLKLKFVPPKTATYIFKSSNSSSIDPDVALYDKDGGRLASDTAGGDFNFTSSELTKNQTYYLVVTNYSSTSTNSLYVNVSYGTIKKYTVTLQKDSGVKSVDGAGSYEEGETVSISAELNSGYNWVNWTGYQTLSNQNTSFVMPQSDVTLTANTILVVPDTVYKTIYVGDNNNLTLPASTYDGTPKFENQSGVLVCSFTPQIVGRYVFTSSQSSSTDPIAKIFLNKDLSYGSDDEGKQSHNQFMLTTTDILEAGVTYLLYVKSFSKNRDPSTIDITVNRTSECVITYDSKGGVPIPERQLVAHQTYFSLPNNLTKDPLTIENSTDFYINFETQLIYPTKTITYYFYSWLDGDGTNWSKDGTPKVFYQSTLHYEAQWNEQIKYLVKAPRASKNPQTQEKTIYFYKSSDNSGSYETATSSATTTYQFNGWWTTKSSGGTQRISEDEGTYFPTEQETLFARWKENTSDYSQIVFPTFTKTGYRLKGFSTTQNSSTIDSGCTPGSSKINPANEYYTVWEKLSYQYTLGSANYVSTSGSTQTSSQKYGNTITLKAVPNTGYHFVKWKSDNTDLIKDITSQEATFSMPAGAITMTPVVEPNEYTITYNITTNANTGDITSNCPAETKFTYSSSTSSYINLSSSVPTRTGYVFKGWAVSPNTSTVTYNSGAKFYTKYSNNITLYAVWKKTLTLNYISSVHTSGSVPSEQTADVYNKSTEIIFTIDENKQSTLKRTGYTFKGWSTDQNDTSGQAQGSKITISKNTTLYAIWSINYYAVLWDKGPDENGNNWNIKFQDGTGTISNTKYSHGSKFTLEALPNEYNGQIFSRWTNYGRQISTDKEFTFTVFGDSYIKANFASKNLSILINCSLGYDDVKAWIKGNTGTSNKWSQISLNQNVGYPTVEDVELIIEDGENYEFKSITGGENTPLISSENGLCTFRVNGSEELTLVTNSIPKIYNIYDSTGKQKKTAYIKDPLFNEEEQINSIWIGDKQIFGDKLTRPYPYKKDALIENILYIGQDTDSISTSYTDNLEIQKVVIPNGITKIAVDDCFKQCTNLQSIHFPDTLTSTGTYVLQGCNNLKKCYLPDNLIQLNHGFFSGCLNLTKIIFPKNLEHITYYSCGNLENIVRINLKHTKLKIIGGSAFHSCLKLKLITLPDTLEEIKGSAFASCSNLQKIYYLGTIQQWNNIDIVSTGNEYLLNATIYCKDGIINPKEEN